MGVWVGPRTGLDEVVKRKKSQPYWESNPGRPAHILVIIVTEMIFLHEILNIFVNVNHTQNLCRYLVTLSVYRYYVEPYLRKRL